MAHKQIIVTTVQPIDLVKYAGVSGDFNPVHTVLEEAKKSGHPQLMAHGMYVMGLATQALETWYPEQELASFQVRFQAPTYTGEELSVSETKVSTTEQGVVEGAIEVTNAQEQVKLKGTFVLKEVSVKE